MILVNVNEVPARHTKVSARLVARHWHHFEWLILDVNAFAIYGRVPSAFHGRRGQTNAAQRRADSRAMRNFRVRQ